MKYRFAEYIFEMPGEWSVSDKTLQDERNLWVINWLKAIGRYPHKNQTYYGEEATLAEQLPKKFFKKSHLLAIDLVLIPYHGRHYQNENEVERSQPKKHTWFNVCVYCKNLNGQRNKHCRQSSAFAYYGVSIGKAKDFFEVYRKRFGIESSYRQSHLARIRTSTRKPLLRLLYFALSMLMRNCWLDFEREVLLAAGRKKQMTNEYMSFKRMLGIIRRTLENLDCYFNPTNSQKTL
jgi:hypothetical protein